MKTNDSDLFKERAMQWATSFEVCCWLDSNHYKGAYHEFDCLLAVGSRYQVEGDGVDSFTKLKSFYDTQKEWMFGLLSYDLKNELENLHTSHPDKLGFPELFFFVPTYLLAIKDRKIRVLRGDPACLEVINSLPLDKGSIPQPIKWNQQMRKEAYLDTIARLKSHILRGDIYEINFCQEFFAEKANIDPLKTYQALNRVSPTPFSGFFKIGDRYILSASPERFLAKRGSRLISQPIKGTAKREKEPQADELRKQSLKESQKERSENVMIVDLVRNDLTKTAVKGTVHVEELYGIYTFPQVHQMISTITSELSDEFHFVDAIQKSFPMGSMTGAPKISAMKLIDTYEKSKRGVYSGAMGYISPEGNFDLNVIIRSLLYDRVQQYLSFQVGGAITYASDPQAEYEECMLKAAAIFKISE